MIFCKPQALLPISGNIYRPAGFVNRFRNRLLKRFVVLDQKRFHNSETEVLGRHSTGVTAIIDALVEPVKSNRHYVTGDEKCVASFVVTIPLEPHFTFGIEWLKR